MKINNKVPTLPQQNGCFPQQENKDEFRVTLSFNVMIRGAAGSPDQLTHHIY